MKLADNMGRHTISEEFEFGPDRTIVFGVTCPLMQKRSHIRHCLEYSLLSFNRNVKKLADNLDRHKISDVSNSGKIRLFTKSDYSLWSYLPLSAKNPIFDFV